MDTTTQRDQSFFTRQSEPILFILSGPSGVGKDAALLGLKKKLLPLTYVVTMTTRPPREAETDGIDYRFVSKEQFKSLIDTDGLLEWANVYENMYGVPADTVEDSLQNGRDVMVKVDIQGVDNIKNKKPNAISIFLMPESYDDLFSRLKKRNTESEESLKIRMATATAEMEKVKEFDYAVINPFGKIDEAVSQIEAIITAEKCRVRK